jgi:hypothetical protein
MKQPNAFLPTTNDLREAFTVKRALPDEVRKLQAVASRRARRHADDVVTLGGWAGACAAVGLAARRPQEAAARLARLARPTRARSPPGCQRPAARCRWRRSRAAAPRCGPCRSRTACARRGRPPRRGAARRGARRAAGPQCPASGAHGNLLDELTHRRDDAAHLRWTMSKSPRATARRLLNRVQAEIRLGRQDGEPHLDDVRVHRATSTRAHRAVVDTPASPVSSVSSRRASEGRWQARSSPPTSPVVQSLVSYSVSVGGTLPAFWDLLD